MISIHIVLFLSSLLIYYIFYLIILKYLRYVFNIRSVTMYFIQLLFIFRLKYDNIILVIILYLIIKYIFLYYKFAGGVKKVFSHRILKNELFAPTNLYLSCNILPIYFLILNVLFQCAFSFNYNFSILREFYVMSYKITQNKISK